MKKETSKTNPKSSSREEGIGTPLPAAVNRETAQNETETETETETERPRQVRAEDNDTGDLPVATVDTSGATGNLPPRLPNESHEQYQRFVWFFQHGRGLGMRAIARKLSLAYGSAWTARRSYAWDARVQEFLLGHTQPAEDSEAWQARREELRHREWLLHLELISAAQEALRRWRESDKVPNPGEIVRLIELASRLGRLASGLPLDHTEISGSESNPLRVKFELAVRKIYGESQLTPAGGSMPGVEPLSPPDHD